MNEISLTLLEPVRIIITKYGYNLHKHLHFHNEAQYKFSTNLHVVVILPTYAIEKDPQPSYTRLAMAEHPKLICLDMTTQNVMCIFVRILKESFSHFSMHRLIIAFSSQITLALCWMTSHLFFRIIIRIVFGLICFDVAFARLYNC